MSERKVIVPRKSTKKQNETDVIEVVKFELPPKYKVILLNDNVTTFDFVIEILMSVFHKSSQEAEQITMNVHNNGSGIAGIYSYDIAQTKINQVKKQATEQNFPLQLKMEKDQ